MSSPHLIYAPIAGRAELIRLIAAAGGLEMTEDSKLEYFGKPTAGDESKTDYLSPSGMPLLKHGELKLSQSGAIEAYLTNIAPRYSGLTVEQRAIDNMWQGIKEEILANCAKAIFTTQKTDKEQAKKDVTDLLDKWFAIFEDKAPSDGFIQGLDFPTSADLVLLNISIGFMPFGAAIKLAEYDISKWAKVKALCDRTAADEKVAKYLKSETNYTTNNPFGF